MRVVDLFAGLGGFSHGALLAGAEVVQVVDNDPVPLKLLGANVSGVNVNLATLGPGGDAIELPSPAPDLHVHASTPCTELSPAKNATAIEVATGVCMLRWALDLFIGRGEHSWSIENVSTPTTRKVLGEYKQRFPERLDFATLDAAECAISGLHASYTLPLTHRRVCCCVRVAASALPRPGFD
jgi:site-specific DNA-cytosine methylase